MEKNKIIYVYMCVCFLFYFAHHSLITVIFN